VSVETNCQHMEHESKDEQVIPRKTKNKRSKKKNNEHNRKSSKEGKQVLEKQAAVLGENDIMDEEKRRLFYLRGYAKKLKKHGSIFTNLWNRRYWAVERVDGYNLSKQPVCVFRLSYFQDEIDFEHGLCSHPIDIREIIELYAILDEKPKLKIVTKNEKNTAVVRFKHIRDFNYWSLGLSLFLGIDVEGVEEPLGWPVDMGDPPKHYASYIPTENALIQGIERTN